MKYSDGWDAKLYAMPWPGHAEGVKEAPAASSRIPFLNSLLKARQTGDQWVCGLAVGRPTRALVSACPDITVLGEGWAYLHGMGLVSSLIMKVCSFVLKPFLYNYLKEGCSKVGSSILLLSNK